MGKSVIIAGAGPSGLHLARLLSNAGFEADVYEPLSEAALVKRHDWSDAVHFSALDALGIERPTLKDGRYCGKYVKNLPESCPDALFEPHAITGLAIFSPNLKYRTKKDADFQYILTDRTALCAFQLRKALEAGARIHFETKVSSLLGEFGSLESTRVTGARITKGSDSRDVFADLVVDATGLCAALRSQLQIPELSRGAQPNDLAYASRVVLRYAGEINDPLFCDHYRYGYKQGYFWLHFHDHGIVDIGGGIPRSTQTGTDAIVHETLERFGLQDAPRLRGGHGLTFVGRSPDSLVTSGFLSVGDSAGQVNPTNGCGVHGALVAAGLAAQVIAGAGAFDLQSLWEYNHKWFVSCGLGAQYAALHTFKDFLQQLSMEEIDRLVKKGILSGSSISAVLSNEFQDIGLSSALYALFANISRPGVLKKLSSASSSGKRVLRKYRQYPKEFERKAFSAWQNGV